jgi:dihydroflavonol-4-reductase
MDSCFLTGATGFVGANLARVLLERGYRVRCLARKRANRKNIEGLPVEVVEGDLLDKAALRAGCAGVRYVFHVAADYRIWVPDPASMYAANVDGSVAVVEEAVRAGAERIVHCSSVAAVKLLPDARPADERSQYGSESEIIGPYKKSKWLAERAVLALAAKGAPVVVVNPAAPIGPHDVKPTPTGRIVLDFLTGRMPSYIDTGLNVVHARDAAEGHLLAALKGRAGERYILGGQNLTLKQVLDLLAAHTGLKAPRFKTPYPIALAFAAGETALARVLGFEPRAPLDAVRMARHYMYFDSSKAARELGFKPRPASQALRDAAEWFCANGFAPRPAGLLGPAPAPEVSLS